jgi:hypothetical protein
MGQSGRFARADARVQREVATDVPSTEIPLEQARLFLRDGATRRVKFNARWRSTGGTPVLAPALGTLRIQGAPGEGDSGLVRLTADRWQVRGDTLRYRYVGAGLGIRSVVIRPRRNGGSIRIRGGTDAWKYALERAQTHVTVTLEVGGIRWCAGFGGPDLRKNRRRRLRAASATPPTSCACALSSTWEAIQRVVFPAHGCTSAVCHGSGSGGLFLHPELAYESLVNVQSGMDPRLRVAPGAAREDSMLWRKLAAETLGLEGVPGSPMPISGTPLSERELLAIAIWIESGAPQVGVVPGTYGQLGVCVLPAGP